MEEAIIKAMTTNMFGIVDVPSAFKEGFKCGAKWQKEPLIDKACEWLENHNNYQRVSNDGHTVRFDITQCVMDFRKAMEK